MDPLAGVWIQQVIAGSPVASAFGVEVTSAAIDEVSLRLAFADELTTVPGVIHGGVVATLVDIAGAAASASGVRADEGASGGATSHLTISYLAPAGSDLTARAKVVHRTRSGTQSHVEVHDADGRLVATGQVSSRIFH